MSNIDKQALREEFRLMQAHYSDPADRARQVIYIAAEALLDELDKKQQYIKLRDQENEDIALTVGKLRVELEHYKSREERVTKLVLDNSTSWDALYKKLEAAEKRIAELTDQKATWVTWAENASGMVDMLRLRIAELERSETQLINERDSAESALNDAYKAVMGQAPEWSNWFSFENAIDEIELVCELWRNQTDDVIQFRQRIQELEAKLETTDRLQDGAFRDGLKAGFSYGQTDDQSGFTQCMSAYNTTPASLLPDGLIRAVHFYEQVKRENPPVETGAWKDAIDWVLKEACLAASTLESSREHEAISQQEKA